MFLQDNDQVHWLYKVNPFELAVVRLQASMDKHGKNDKHKNLYKSKWDYKKNKLK